MHVAMMRQTGKTHIANAIDAHLFIMEKYEEWKRFEQIRERFPNSIGFSTLAKAILSEILYNTGYSVDRFNRQVKKEFFQKWVSYISDQNGMAQGDRWTPGQYALDRTGWPRWFNPKTGQRLLLGYHYNRRGNTIEPTALCPRKVIRYDHPKASGAWVVFISDEKD